MRLSQRRIGVMDDQFKTRRIYTAWDNIGDEAVFFRGVDLLEAEGVNPDNLMVYMLVGYDPRETWDPVVEYQLMMRNVKGFMSLFHAAIRTFEPDTKQLLDHLLPVAVETAVQQALYNSVASEVAARRSAMDSATDNATELIGELTLKYNRERQAAITKELMEIIGGAEALKG